MSIRGGIGVINQFRIEATPGAGGAGNKILRALNFNLGMKRVTSKFRPHGFRAITAIAKHKEWAGGDFDGLLCYNTLPYIFDGLFNAAAPQQVGAIQAYERNWIAGMKTSDLNRKTFCIEQGDATAADIYKFVQLQSLSLEATQDSFGVKGNLVSQYPTPNQALSAGATEVVERPVERGDIQVYIDDSAAQIGTTPMTGAIQESFNIGEKFVEVFFHNRAVQSFTDVVEKPGEPTFTFQKEHDAQSRALLASITSQPRKFIRWEAQGNLLGNNGATPVHELLQIDMAVEFDGEPKPLGIGEDVFAYEYPCSLIADKDFTTYLKIKSICGLATL